MITKATKVTHLPPSLADMVWLDEYNLGYGLNAVTGSISPKSAIDLTNSSVTSAKHFTVNQKVHSISSESDFKNAMNLSGNVKFNIGAGEASSQTSYSSSIDYSETTTTIIAHSNKSSLDYESIDLDNVKLTDDAQKLLHKNIDEFRSIYGDYFVSGAKVGCHLVAMYVCTAKSSESMKDFKASASASYGGLFSSKGTAEFLNTAKSHDITTTFKYIIYGANKDIPTNFDDIPSALLWFNDPKNTENTPEKAFITHYSEIMPKFPQTVPVDPSIFTAIQNLYALNSLVKDRYLNCPGSYGNEYGSDYTNLQNTIFSNASELPNNTNLITKATEDATSLLSNLNNVYDRNDFYRQTQSEQSKEPKQGSAIDAEHSNSWAYGYNSTTSPVRNVPIQSHTLSYKKGWHSGHRSHVFDSGAESAELIVGWSIKSNKSDNGSWTKNVDTILLGHQLEITLESDFDRGIDYSVTYYTVPSILFDFN
jgi:hypothetical protein